MSAAFMEVQFPTWISFWATGGKGFQTVLTRTHGGQRYAQRDWLVGLGKWSVADALAAINNEVNGATISTYAYSQIQDLFNCGAAMWGGFRWKDFKDYRDDGRGICGAGTGTGVLTYQMNKSTTVGGLPYVQPIYKPRPTGGSDACTIQLNSATAGGATYDSATGLASYVATASQTISTATAGATTTFHLSGALTGIGIGKYVVVLGTSGDIGSATNGKSAHVSGVSGNNITVDIDTTGLTGGSGGSMSIGPQPSDTIGWIGQYDYAVAFATDDPAAGPDQSTGALIDWQSLEVEEIRNPFDFSS